ncbi:MAG: FHA domain-containing protein [Woeseiaceae bacterium]
MDLGAAGLLQQPFPDRGELVANESYASQRLALDAMQAAHSAFNGLCLLQGPPLSGKSTVIRQYVESLPEGSAVAIVDGKHLNTTGLLEAVLRQFGYILDHGSVSELLAMLRVFSMQQTVSQQPPLLIVKHTNELNPSALRALCDLAALKVRQFSAMKMILASDTSLLPIIETPPMEAIRKRVTHNFHLRPMSSTEAREYLHAKVEAAGCDQPESLFPTSICDELWRASGGWPGIFNRVALQALSKAKELPVTADLIETPALPKGTWIEETPTLDDTMVEPVAEPPTFYVTLDGLVLREITMDESSRVLVGRSEHNDVSLNSKFVSRHHALLVRNGNSSFVMDLNSANGVFVNSKPVTNHRLAHDDVISIGKFRIKFVDTDASLRGEVDSEQFAETAIMKTLDDMRNLISKEGEEQTSPSTENLPTAGI